MYNLYIEIGGVQKLCKTGFEGDEFIFFSIAGEERNHKILYKILLRRFLKIGLKIVVQFTKLKLLF